MSRKRNTFSKAIGHLKSTKIDEKLEVLNEIPTNNTIIGGFLIFMAIIYYSLTIKTNRRFIALN